jgi:hypothetical protein
MALELAPSGQALEERHAVRGVALEPRPAKGG